MNNRLPKHHDINDYFALLGKVSVRLSQLDHLVSFAIGYLASKDNPGYVVYITNEIISIPARLKILDSLGDKILPEKVNIELKKYISQIKGINKRRNSYIHTMWDTSHTPPYHFNWKKLDSSDIFERVSFNNLQTLADDAEKTAQEFYDFMDTNIRQPTGRGPASIKL